MKTKKRYEQHLNEIGNTFENCEYLANKERGQHLKPQSLIMSLHENRYGTILRKYDPTAFEVGYNEWRRGQ